MQLSPIQQKETLAYTLLTSLVICGLAGSLITAPKIVHLGLDFPFSNIIFSLLTYPIVDCICELWGKQAARLALWLGLGSQILLTCLIQLSILAPAPAFWHLQAAYQTTLSTGLNVVCASLIAFTLSQMLDIVIYQRIKNLCSGKWLWLRSNLSTYLGQVLDSLIFVTLVFYHSPQKWTILYGSLLVKIILSLLMTPLVYLIVIITHRYLDGLTLAFKNDHAPERIAPARNNVYIG